LATKPTQEWFAKARSDLQLVEFLYETSGERFLSQMAFHCQQCVEKSIKGYLNHFSKKFRKTHDIAELLLIVKSFNPDLCEELKICVTLTDYAIVYRYPDAEIEPLTLDKTNEARVLAKNTYHRLLEFVC
jgi:HEPN domain-containing protein